MRFHTGFSATVNLPLRYLSTLACLSTALIVSTQHAIAALPPVDSSANGASGTQGASAVGPCGGPCSYFEDFDDTADFIAGTWIGNGLNGAAGGVFETWAAQCSAMSGNTTEGHVETAHPFSGTQHVRISNAATAITSPFGCVLDARVPASDVAVVGPISPNTISAELAFPGSTGAANFVMQPQSPGLSMRTTTVLFFYYGDRYVIDRRTGGFTFVWAGIRDTTGAYEKYTIHTDPCAKWTCNRGANDALPCANSLDCPGGTCNGLIEYSDGDGVFYTGQLWAAPVQDQILFWSDNAGDPNHPGLDIDDVAIERDPNPCPVICGDSIIGTGEECDIGIDIACPGRCVPPDGTGSFGELECTCDISACVVSNDLPNGGPQAFGNHFGWFTFTASAPAYAVESCGTTEYDSQLSVWAGTCDSLAFIIVNDDCYGGPVYGAGSDPLASCYNGPSALSFPYNSCTCIATNEGQEYWVFDSGVSFVDETIITLTKRLACDNASSFGACCDPFVGCVDVTDLASCNVLGGIYTDRKTCTSVGDQCPPPDRGACCDRLTSTCLETTEPGCIGNRTFSFGVRCEPGVCQPDKGACCVQTAFNGTCSVTKDIDCDDFFTAGSDCTQVACGPAVIPAVSEWGLVVLALSLLILAKVRSRRSARTT